MDFRGICEHFTEKHWPITHYDSSDMLGAASLEDAALMKLKAALPVEQHTSIVNVECE